MRKFFLFLFLLLFGISIASWVVWTNKENLAAQLLSRALRVPATVRALGIAGRKADLARLWIGNPPHSKTSTSFSAESIAIRSSIGEVLAKPLTIEEIEIENIFVGIESYESGKTNWDAILAKSNAGEKSGEYLIRKVVLENMTLEVTDASGEIRRYPTVHRMEFANVSSQSGFPTEEVEKAIFNLMIEDLLKRFHIDTISR